ncbi:MAG: DpnI domain-containing protein [candidate division Zixibacteria bacterium]|nr:DpnI domain-containing protein [candidate division Zixibacteria bacterium]
MQVKLSPGLANNYTSLSQKVRVFSEEWVHQEGFCPSCGSKLDRYKNNQQSKDFNCDTCNENFELKSSSNAFGAKVLDGAYSSMIASLNSDKSSSLLLLRYDRTNHSVRDFLVIPRHFFVPSMIQKRNPLSPSAKRYPYVGCSILIGSVPEAAKVYFLKEGVVIPKKQVMSEWTRGEFLRGEKKFENKSWLVDTMKCIDMLKHSEFSLSDIYEFEGFLTERHPNNRFIKDKLRQQLQILRDNGYLQFLGNGKYRLER